MGSLEGSNNVSYSIAPLDIDDVGGIAVVRAEPDVVQQERSSIVFFPARETTPGIHEGLLGSLAMESGWEVFLLERHRRRWQKGIIPTEEELERAAGIDLAVCESLGLSRIAAVGHSAGAPRAVRMARRILKRPELDVAVESMIFISPSGMFEGETYHSLAERIENQQPIELMAMRMSGDEETIRRLKAMQAEYTAAFGSRREISVKEIPDMRYHNIRDDVIELSRQKGVNTALVLLTKDTIMPAARLRQEMDIAAIFDQVAELDGYHMHTVIHCEETAAQINHLLEDFEGWAR